MAYLDILMKHDNVNKNLKTAVSIAQKVDLIDQKQYDLGIQHVKIVLNQIKKCRQ